MYLKCNAMVGQNSPTSVKMFSKSMNSQYSNEILGNNPSTN